MQKKAQTLYVKFASEQCQDDTDDNDNPDEVPDDDDEPQPGTSAEGDRPTKRRRMKFTASRSWFERFNQLSLWIRMKLLMNQMNLLHGK